MAQWTLYKLPSSQLRRRCILTDVRIILRVIALISALSVAGTSLFIARFGAGGISALLATGIFGLITLFGWLITFIAGPIAAVQLFRLKPSGRAAAAVLFAAMLAYYLTGLIAFRQPGMAVGPVVAIGLFSLCVLVIVLSPAAKRVCTVRAVTAQLLK
jgi:hypothetical protein